MKAVFLDRDGTINIDTNGYIAKPDEFCLYPFAIEAIKCLNNMGFKVIIVSNQSGIARGYFTEKDLEIVHNHMLNTFFENNVFIDLILYSPFHPNGIIEPFNISHNSRKPQAGMFYEALKKFPIKANDSYMIGDSQIDIEFGKKNGLTSFLVKTGNGEKLDIIHSTLRPDFIVENILSAAHVIKIIERQKNSEKNIV